MPETKENKRSIKEFYENNYVDWASYDNFRKIASYIDGLKPSSRKIMHTVIKNKIHSPLKLSQLCSKVSEQCAYIHGEVSLFGVAVGLAQDFPGTNNLPLLKREGNFGTRMEPEASAPRYIFTCMEDYLDLYINPDDSPVLIGQVFEGDEIEPRFFVPTLPLLLVNGSEGISPGFAQKVLPRSVKDVKKYLTEMLAGKKPTTKLVPYFEGFNGTVRRGENGWEILGKIEVVNPCLVKITEIPVNYSLEQYQNVLDALQEKGVIQSYKDLASSDFTFEVRVPRTFTAGRKDTEMMEDLKLVKKVTENFTCCNESLSITEFKDQFEVIEAYAKVKLEFLEKRRVHQIAELKRHLMVNVSRYAFVKGVVEGTIVLSRKTAEQVDSQLKRVKEISVGEDGTYGYLLGMPMSSVTKERLQKLQDAIRELKARYDDMKSKTAKDIWLSELERI